MNIFRKKQPGFDLELLKLEKQLDQTLNPVVPRSGFVRDLKARLFTGDFEVNKRWIPQKVSNTLLVIGGIIGSVIMLIASVRGLISLISALGTYIQTKNNQKQQVSTA
jgi:hypothetical protein